MLDRNVRQALFKKIRITPQAVNQRAKRLKEKYGPMTTNEAVYIIAHTEGIDLGKYLPLATLDRVRSLIPRDIRQVTSVGQNKSRAVKSGKKAKTEISYPLIKSNFIQQALYLGEETFPKMVVLENSIRNLIEKRLSKIRKDWWTALVPEPVQKDVQRIINIEKKYPYREKRGNTRLLYCNWTDLKKIVCSNWSTFSRDIMDLPRFEVKMDEIYMARNNLAHSILLSKDDITRINLFYREWARVLEASDILILSK